ncbi:MAG: hypothetical protein RJQ14_09040 [Marinoscillum sp.]
MKLIIAGVFLSLGFSQCSAQDNTIKLEGTQWEYSYNADVKDNIRLLKDGKFKSYSGESMMTSIGVYFVKDDTLNLVSVIDVDNDNRFTPKHTKAVIDGHKLRYVTSDRIVDGEWKKSNFVFDPQYYLTKVK